MTGVPEAGGENLGRLKSKLRRHAGAMSTLRRLGLEPATIERLHLGLKEPYRSRADGVETRDALCFPLLVEGCRPVGRYACIDLPGITVNPQSPGGWGPGPPVVYRLGSFAPDAVAVVSAGVVDCWLAWQLSRGGMPEAAFLSRTHGGGWPPEWRSPQFWSRFNQVVLLPGPGVADFLADVAPRLGRPLSLVELPPPFVTFGDFVVAGATTTIVDMVREARPWALEPPRSATAIPQDGLGRFEAAPVRIAGAFEGGHCYYPFLVECRAVEQASGGASRVVQAYSTMVLRSDGHLLAAELLPAPRGTTASRRVLALSDGTRILEEPIASGSGTWSHASIERFVRWRTSGGGRPFRPLAGLVADVEAFLSARIWLPGVGDHLLAALYVVLSHVFQVFDAIPLLLVRGGRATGKSELGEAMGRLGFNATVAGQLRAAGMIRLLDETRGLLVLDDMDGDGPASVVGNGELAQALKTGYKRSTSRKPLADRGGRVRMVDFYGPKVVGNTRGVDDVLGSRVLTIATGAAPTGFEPSFEDWGGDRLDAIRDELHCWGMACAADVHEAYRALPAPADRQAEIRAPLLAIAATADDDGALLSRIVARLGRRYDGGPG